MQAFSRFRVPPDAEASFVARAEAAVAFFRTRAGNRSAELVRNLDEDDLWAISTTWVNVGAYRRSFSGYEAKMTLVPLLSQALDEPSAYATPDELGGGFLTDGVR